MSVYTQTIENLIEKLIKLPGIGRRSAERIVSYLLEASLDEVKLLSKAIEELKENTRLCRMCNNLSEAELCKICADSQRNKSIVCVVERPADVLAIEKSGTYRGTYHVLMGAISPLEGVGPSALLLGNLISRIKNGQVKELIIATDADSEGEATALYLAKTLKPLGVKLSRIGIGVPLGATLEYIDSSTLSKALESRREI